MSDIEIKSNTIFHKNSSLKRLDVSFLKHINFKEYKTSDLLAYWIKDFSRYHDEEKYFDCSKSGVFSRGNIIKANLGFNIGNELGGLHYCIILNKYDNMRNGTLNIVPLTSRKENKKYNASTVNLGNELYNILNFNLEKEKIKFNEILLKLNRLDDIPSLLQKTIEIERTNIKKLEKEISKMKQDSIVLINQITTISKQRIYTDSLIRKVKLSNNSLNLIDEHIIKYFTK